MPVIAPVESFFDAHLLAVAGAAGIEPSDIVKPLVSMDECVASG
jgi:hypothetical protein